MGTGVFLNVSFLFDPALAGIVCIVCIVCDVGDVCDRGFLNMVVVVADGDSTLGNA